MGKKFKVVYYLNQFFGQIGGEDKAGIKPQFIKGNIKTAYTMARATSHMQTDPNTLGNS